MPLLSPYKLMQFNSLAEVHDLLMQLFDVSDQLATYFSANGSLLQGLLFLHKNNVAHR
jgi:hypothetical protein